MPNNEANTQEKLPSIATWQLALRFGLEVSSLLAVGAWGYQTSDNFIGILAMLGGPLLLAILWGTFAVKGDPSRSGAAPVAVPGWVRLLLELLVFGAGAASLAALGRWVWLAIFVAAFLLHHLGTTARLVWLLRER